MSKRRWRGGLYVWRTKKPWAVWGLPIIGRHFAYTGMTNLFSAREGQQLRGSVTYGKPAASWSDLKPRVYRIPLPDWLFAGERRRAVVKALETCLIGITCPVYNAAQQPPWNTRKISRKDAAEMRRVRDENPKVWYWMNAGVSSFGLLIAAIAVVLLTQRGWM
jgi:hypothetical protein